VNSEEMKLMALYKFEEA